MTTGSWNNSIINANVINQKYKTWSGGDRPRVAYEKPAAYTIVRDGKTYWIRPRGGRPPRRVRDEPHPYTVSMRNSQDRRTAFRQADCVWAPNWQHAYATNAHTDGTDCTLNLIDSSTMIKTVAKLRESIFGSDFNASVFLGESHQTLGLIANSANRVYTSLRYLKKGNVPQAAQALLSGTARVARKHRHSSSGKLDDKSLSSAWLELQYGWLPLLSETEAAAKMLAKHLEVPFQKRYKAVAKVARYSPKSFYNGTSGPCRVLTNYVVMSESVYRVTVHVTEKPSIAAQLGLLNPENVAWELMPWSFVIDWFIPIGSYLDARAVGSCVAGTYVQSNKHQFFVGMVRPDTVFDASDFMQRGCDYTRTVSSAPTLPTPSFKGLASAASWQHCANAIALLSQLR